jgi:tRNA 2-thiouridine synthesizing protein A
MNPDEILDVRRMTCPIPVLKTRKKLKQIGSGVILKIIGDFKPAKENIKKFLEKEGHKILEIQDNGKEYHLITKIK